MTEGLQAKLGRQDSFSGTGSSSLQGRQSPHRGAPQAARPQQPPRSTAPSHIRALPGFPAGGKDTPRPHPPLSSPMLGSDAERAPVSIQPLFL